MKVKNVVAQSPISALEDVVLIDTTIAHELQEVGLSRTAYHKLRQHFDCQPVMFPTVVVLVVDLLLLSLVFLSLQSANCLFYLFGQLLLVLICFHSFCILHDCGHGNCSKHSWVNTLIGLYTSILCCMPFFPWKYVHAQHHAWAGNISRDPTLKLIREYKKSTTFRNVTLRLCWRLWIPLLALAQHLVLWTYPIELCKQGNLSFKKLCACCLSIFIPLSAYLLFAWIFPAISLLKLAPAVIVYLLAVELVNFPHHMDTDLFGHEDEQHKKLPLWEQCKITRSCSYPRLLAKALVLNFNLHIEHHLFPRLPWHRLETAREGVRAALGKNYRESKGLNWNVENRTRDLSEVFIQEYL